MIFTIPGKPQGKARARTFYNPRLGRSQSITPSNTVLYENLIKQRYLAAEDKKQWLDKRIPLQMRIVAFFEIPRSTSKRDKKKMKQGEILPCKKPDADNIAKVICDALNGIAYTDDTQIVSLCITKEYTEYEPGVLVSIHEYKLEESEWQDQ